MSVSPLHLIILAGGGGTRARPDRSAPPKQFTVMAGRILLAWSARALGAHPAVVDLTVTCDVEWREMVTEALPTSPTLLFADPGATRTASTWNALEVLRARVGPDENDLVAVHDAARPFATADLLGRVYEAARNRGGAVPALPVADTIVARRSEVDGPVRYLERDTRHAVQTPQVFRWSLLHDVHAWAAEQDESYTDDGGLLAAHDDPPVIVLGEQANWKVTTAADLARACEILEGES